MGWPDEREGAADGTARAGDAGGVSFRISGNTISGPFAAGYHAQATQWNQPTDELLARLDDALRELMAGASPLGTGDYQLVQDDAVQLRAEVTSPRPDRDKVMGLLGQMTARAGSVAALLAIVDRIKELVSALLH